MKAGTRPPVTVDEYMDQLPEDVRIVLEKLRKVIKAAAPGAEEVISYQMPTFRFHGPLVHFAAFKDHCSFFPGKKIAEEYAADLTGYECSGATIRFTIAKPLPVLVVKKIVKRRVKENEESAKLKQKAKAGKAKK